MTEHAKAIAATASGRSHSLALFGAPPLLQGEDKAAYDGLLARISDAVNPMDVIEEIWVRDVVDLSWDVLRLRRLKASLITVSLHKGLARLLNPLMETPEARELSERWAARRPSAIKKVRSTLAAANLSMEDVTAEALALSLDDVEKIDRMIMMAETRRNSILREIDRHRAVLGEKLRHAAQSVDAEFDIVRPEHGGRRYLK